MRFHSNIFPSLFFLSIVLGSGGCPGTGGQPTRAEKTQPPASAIHGRYVVLGSSSAGDSVAWARVIVAPNHDCPTIEGAARIPMSPRDNPHGFPVQVCEAAIPFDAQLTLALDGATQSIPVVKRKSSRILVMGDTGCKEKTCTPGTPAQPFGSLSAAATTDPPDVILHMGDYNYRGTGARIRVAQDGQTTEQWSYDAGDGTTRAENCMQAPNSGFYSQNAPGSQPPDSWENWRDDFFAPAGELLWSAPWVLARGNHELCSRAGPGWFYFLDSSSNLPGGGKQLSCPTPDASADPIDNVVLVEPYRVDLDSLHLLVLDSANACDAFVTPAMKQFTQAYTDQFEQIGTLTPENGTTWLLTHRPIWGVQAYEADKSTGCTPENKLSCMNRVMQTSIQNALDGSLPERIRLALGGHMHQFQSLTFQDGRRPPQVVVGNSGVALSLFGPAGSFDATVQGVPARGRNIGTRVNTASGSISGHGFLDIRYQPDGGWSGTLVNTSANTNLALCGSDRIARGSVCELSPGVSIR